MRRRGARVRKRVPGLSYVGQDGKRRTQRECMVCSGFGSLDWRQQRRIGLSSGRDDGKMRCPHCGGSGIVTVVPVRSDPNGEQE